MCIVANSSVLKKLPVTPSLKQPNRAQLAAERAELERRAAEIPLDDLLAFFSQPEDSTPAESPEQLQDAVDE
jgi:hypothetical protein